MLRDAKPRCSPRRRGGLRVPVAVVNGAEDFVVRMGTRLVDALGVEPVLLPGVGHFDLTAQPAFRELAAAFLKD